MGIHAFIVRPGPLASLYPFHELIRSLFLSSRMITFNLQSVENIPTVWKYLSGIHRVRLTLSNNNNNNKGCTDMTGSA